MRRCIVAITILGFTSALPVKADDALAFCKTISATAENIMKARQGGARMSDIMGILNEGGELDSLLQKLVIQAFEHPAYRTDRRQQRTIRQFENDVYLECAQAAMRRKKD